MMKRAFYLFVFCLVFTGLSAQNNLAVKYSVSNRDTSREEARTWEMAIVANPQRSLYYSPMSLYVDSCESTPEGKAALHEIQMKAWIVTHPDGTTSFEGRKLGLAPDKVEYVYVEKDKSKNVLTVYDKKSGEFCKYTEPFEEMEWTIVGDSTKSILGYDCIMATSDYHGRKWKAYFTLDIPVQDGPWKLRGLPGLILSADGGDDFIITATEVGSTAKEVPQVYSQELYAMGKRKDILKNHEHYILNLQSILEAQGLKANADGSPLIMPYTRRLRNWELDY